MVQTAGLVIRSQVPLAPYTSFRLGGPATFFAEVTTEEEIREAALFAKKEQLPLRVLGAGSNVLVPDDGVAALVVRMCVKGVTFVEESAAATCVVAAAGESWDAVVDAATAQGLYGVENLAGIPGTVGGSVVQNIGAYGTELAHVFAYADVFSIASGDISRVSLAEAAFGYRTSLFKHDGDKIIVRAAFRLARRGSLQLAYPDLARVRDAGEPLEAPLQVAAAVRSIRAAKFPPVGTAGTAGSFFKNPTLSAAEAARLAALFPALPQFPLADGTVKIPLAWILDHVLQLKGFAKDGVRTYEKQPLVIVTTAEASAHSVDSFAYLIAERVRAATGIRVEREVEFFSSEKK